MINLVVCCSLLVVIFVMAAVEDDEMINELAAAGLAFCNNLCYYYGLPVLFVGRREP